MSILKYIGYDITFQEVPGEISLVVDVSGCPLSCPGCHTPYLQQDIGRPLLEDLREIVLKYVGHITCVCFMGGDQNPDELVDAIDICRYEGLKTCLYTGKESVRWDILPKLNYLKLGPYVEERGGLSSPTTNQRFYKIEGTPQDYTMDEITDLFQKEKGDLIT